MKFNQINTFLSNPESQYKPFVRWWWFSGGITKEEIARQMQMMKEQNIGGVEIQTIYDALKGSPLEGKEKIKWLSEEWADLVSFAAFKGKELGLQVDLTFGDGWPFGGPYIEEKMASTKLSGYSMPLGADKEALEIELEDLIEDEKSLVAIIGVKATKENKLTNEMIDLTEKIEDGMILWKKPAENYVMFWYFTQPTGQKVKRAAPAGEGLVLDHLNHKALNIHGEKILSTLEPKLGTDLSSHFGAFFCDSWEVYGENWTYHLLDVFKKEKGYDLTEKLPFAIQTDALSNGFLDDEYRAVLYDYNDIHGRMIIEEFFKEFNRICHDSGVKSRVQPYCAPTDLLKAYGTLDICEIEGFGKHGIGTMYYGNVDPRIASSGAHVYGKEWVSCESMTWLGEHFCVSLEKMKKEADQILLHGVHRIIYHGFPYSPKEVGNPGWIFYASCLVNHNNTWWPYMKYLNNYIAKNATIAQNGKYISDFAVYLPYHDEWSGISNTLQELRKNLKGNGHLNDFDYVNDDILLNFVKLGKNNQIIVSSQDYKALILYDVDYIPLETLQKIQDLVRNGMKIYFVGKSPSNAPGFQARNKNHSNSVRNIMDWFRSNSKTNKDILFLKEIPLLDESLENNGIIPDCSIKTMKGERADAFYIHYKYEDADFYFVINEGQDQDLEIQLRSIGDVEVWDLIENSYVEKNLTKNDIEKNFIEIVHHLKNHESKWIVVNKESFTRPKWLMKKNMIFNENCTIINEIELKNSWKITFPSQKNIFPEESKEQMIFQNQPLFDWKDKEITQYYSGTVVYDNVFEIGNNILKESDQILLKLGKFYNIAEIWINNENIGVLWSGTNMLSIKKSHLKQGENSIIIKITNLLLNKIKGYDAQNKKWSPDYYFVNIKYGDFEPRNMEFLKSGLMGPVKFSFFKFIYI